ncbi:MAG: YlmC/YmxH family sporulation protein [Oscillospiraceae bacterium]|nr:YlmC/YmxH family sporulation protein [Oscillospiraceae bacterium]
MKSRITELGCKEVINICDGTRYGYVNDVEVDCACGRVVALIIHGSKLSSFFSKTDDIIIPWEAIKRIGEDIILVDFVPEDRCKPVREGIFSKKL